MGVEMSLDAIGRARSGLQVASAKLEGVAHNTANLATKDFHELSVEGVETKSGAKVQISTRSRSGTSPVEQSVERRIAAVTYSANLAVLKAADDMVGETIDILE